MQGVIAIVVLAAIAAAGVAGARACRIRRRRQARKRPFPPEWAKILEQNLPVYARLTPALREELHGDVNVFLAEKLFEGCGGLAITDEIKVTIAAQACMLLLNRTDNCYPRLRSILVYPSTYVAGGKGLFSNAAEPRSVRLGESWNRGVVVQSWSNVKQGAFNFCDGHNVTMHEFAHQLDQEDGAPDGTPILERRSAYSSWARIFSREFHQLQEKTNRGKPAVMDAYGSGNPAEFFAVATETFFEKPRQLHTRHPDLYQQLRDYYNVDPMAWL